MGSRCIHCKNQAPYLKTLDSDARTAGAIDVVPVFFEADTGRDAFLASFGWQAKAAVVKSADLAAFPIRGTPTLVVADPAGKVTGEYIGELTPAQQAELSTLVKK